MAPLSKVTVTLLSRKPREQGLWIGGLLILVSSLVSLRAWRSEALFEALSASGETVFQNHQYDRLVTALFLHADLGHLLSNAYMLFFLSVFVFGNLTLSVGKAFVLLAVLLAGGALVNGLTLLHYPPQVRLLGISGMVYLLAGFWFVNYLLIDRRHSFSARLLRVIGVGLVILFPTTFEREVSYLAHFHGFWLGAVLGAGYFYLFKNKIRSFEVVETLEEDSVIAESEDP